MEKWFLIDYDGFNIKTRDKVICLDLTFEQAKEIVDAHNRELEDALKEQNGTRSVG
jgi:hypothetical protein